MSRIVPSLLTGLALVAVLLAPMRASSQEPEPFAALDPDVVRAAFAFAEDSLGTDLYLTHVQDLAGGSQYGFDLYSGNAGVWGYFFYSPSRTSICYVAYARISGLLTIVGGGVVAFEPGDPVPLALDTTLTKMASRYLADQLRASPEYQAFRTEHQGDAGPFVSLQILLDGDDYMPDPGFPTDEPTWRASSSRYGDSIFVCHYATQSERLECRAYFYLGADRAAARGMTSDVDFVATNFGQFGDPNGYVIPGGGTTFAAPPGTGNGYIYGAGLWVGAMKGDQPLVFITYNPTSGASWATPGEGYEPRSSYSHPDLYLASNYNEAGDPATADRFRWPLWLPGAQRPTMMNSGNFVAMNGDRLAGLDGYAAFVPEVTDQFVSRFSDVFSADIQRADAADLPGLPIGLQFQQDVFANPAGFESTVFVKHMVINRSGATLRDVVVGQLTDFDIGTATNDRTRFYSARPELRTGVAYSGVENRIVPFGTLVTTLLEAPMTDGSGVVDNTLRSQYRTDGRVGTYRSWVIEHDPRTMAARYSFMTNGWLDTDTSAGDRRSLLVSQPFDMEPGDTAHFAVAYTLMLNKRTITTTDSAMEYRVENVIDAYYGIEASSIGDASAAAALSLSVAPNPARDHIRMQVALPSAAVATLSLVDHLGRVVVRRELGRLDSGSHEIPLNVSGLPAGAYTGVVVAGGERVSIPIVVVR